MNSVTGRWLWLLMVATLPAAEALWRQDFDGQVPGDRPESWAVAWGDAGDDLLVISNLRAASGRRSWLLDRSAPNATTMCGYSTRFPDMTEGWLNLDFSFLVQGKANNVRVGVEVRAASPADRVVAVGLNGRAVRLATPDGKLAVELGNYTEDCWHRIRLWLPTAKGSQDRAVALLERRDGEGWEPAGAAGAVPARAPANGYGIFMPCTWPGKRGFLLFLDDLAVRAAEAPPP